MLREFHCCSCYCCCSWAFPHLVAKKGNDVKPTTTTIRTGAKAVATAAAPAPVPVPITATTQRQQRQQLRQRPRQRQRQLCPQVRGSAPAPFLASSKYPVYKGNEQHTRMYNTDYIYIEIIKNSYRVCESRIHWSVSTHYNGEEMQMDCCFAAGDS